MSITVPCQVTSLVPEYVLSCAASMQISLHSLVGPAPVKMTVQVKFCPSLLLASVYWMPANEIATHASGQSSSSQGLDWLRISVLNAFFDWQVLTSHLPAASQTLASSHAWYVQAFICITCKTEQSCGQRISLTNPYKSMPQPCDPSPQDEHSCMSAIPG